MRRDPELIRQIMLKLEALEKPATVILSVGCHDDLASEGYTYDQVHYHVDHILQHRWIDTAGDNSICLDGTITFRGLTPSGHNFVDSVRDDAIWALTKKGASDAGGFHPGKYWRRWVKGFSRNRLRS
ncbi:DUF2513 domain-containing protein [Stutzerimonas nitrititolerans]|uniref:DUF2513 domain-containing protein n=1 Tax=Stutzerimonas nitrititolerans TaxID=2482751 RepID=UPI0028A13F96|nr:DUF2513 domain-containing protein [Stutzerimonas nitrititolerans]